MSNFGFVKRYRSGKSRELKKKHPSAFLFLDTVAENAKWDPEDKNSHPLLECGEAIVTAEDCGLSDQQFETARKYLEDNSYIEVLHRGRRDQNSKIDPRIKPGTLPGKLRNTSRINGTVVKLIDSSIYDINLNKDPEHIPIQTRNTSGKTPDKEEIKKKKEKKEIHTDDLTVVENDKFSSSLPDNSLKTKKNSHIIEAKELNSSEGMSDNICYVSDSQELKEKSKHKNQSKRKGKPKLYEPEIQKITIRDHVFLTQDELDKLKSLHKDKLDGMLDELDCYKASKGAVYKSDYHVLKKGGWLGNKYLIAPSQSFQSIPQNQFIKEKIQKCLAHGKLYNGFECCIDSIGVGFKKDSHYWGLKFTENGLVDQLNSRLMKMGVDIRIA